MVSTGLYVRLEAKPGKEQEVDRFLCSALPLVQEEPATTAWFAIRMGTSTFGIFDVFPDEAGRQAHLLGKVAAALMEKAPELLAEPPKIEKVEVLESKLASPSTGGKHRYAGYNVAGAEIPMQVGSELRITNAGEIIIDNPELELADDRAAADAVLSYQFNSKANEHVIRLLEPVANRRHLKEHKADD
jgi:quinol monooxygenase YgiN